jgi:AraC family transcriptional regulator
MGVVGIRGLRQPVEEETIPLPDQVCITPPERERTLVFRLAGNKTATLAGITIPIELFNRFAEEEGLPSGMPSLQSLRASGKHDPLLAAVAQATLTAYEAGADDLYAGSAAQFMVAHLLAPRRAANANKPSGPLSAHQLDTVTSYMRENLANPITLDDLSSLISYSRFHFTRCFKETTGSTPYRYLTELRIDMARKLLETSNDTILHISRCCGFSDSRNFVRNFRRFVGCTPSQYRSMCS